MLPTARALGASPSRRGLAAGRSFTSVRLPNLSPAAAGDEQQQQQQGPAAAVLTPAVVMLQPSLLPAAPGSSGSSNRSPTPPPGKPPGSRSASKRALLPAREQQQGGNGSGGAAGSLASAGIAPAVAACSRPASGCAKTHDAAHSAEDAGAEVQQLQALRLSAGQPAGGPAAGQDAAAGPPPHEAADDRGQSLQRALPAVRTRIISMVRLACLGDGCMHAQAAAMYRHAACSPVCAG